MGYSKSELLRSLRSQLHELHEEHDRIGAAISDTIEEIVKVRALPAWEYGCEPETIEEEV